jgi:general secretion pathway protein F
MAVYAYKGIDRTGKAKKGVVDADSDRAARQKLKSDGIFPSYLKETTVGGTSNTDEKGASQKRVSTNQLAIATRQLATLVAAGMPLVDALRALADQIDNTRFRAVISEVTDRVNEGSTLANAMREYPRVFPKIFVNMVASGEATGGLDVVLERLADLLETQAALQRKVLSALAYPVLMLLLCTAVIIILLTFVVPEITKVFESQKAILPLPTRIVIFISQFLASYWWVFLLMAIGGVIGFRSYGKTTKGRWNLDALKLKLPLVGSISLKICSSRFARNLGTLLESGVELLTALSIVKNIVGNVVLEKIVEDSSEGVREGKSLAQELKRGGKFPKLLVHMCGVGEQSGQLDAMLLRAATAFESEVDSVISSLTSILEPVLIVVLAGIVGCILASVMLPMLEMSQLGAR